eukprot:3533687-Rhodomonas_salina.2
MSGTDNSPAGPSLELVKSQGAQAISHKAENYMNENHVNPYETPRFICVAKSATSVFKLGRGMISLHKVWHLH